MKSTERQELEDLIETAILAMGPAHRKEYVAHVIESTYTLTKRDKVGIPDDEEAQENESKMTDQESEGCATEECCEDLCFTPRATAEDKLRMIRDTVEGQAPFGSELANFQRRLRLILGL